MEHFNAVLDMYPLMRRTMESIAAERLNKIGKNPSIVCPREDFQSELKVVSELLTLSAQSPSDDSESDISGIFTRNRLKGTTPLPRPKSESCFPLMGNAVSQNGLDRPGLSLGGGVSAFQRTASLFRAAPFKATEPAPTSSGHTASCSTMNPMTCITVTAPSSTSLNKQ